MYVTACPAKINLYLRVHGRRDDGFHELETLFQEIDLADRLTWLPGPQPLSLDVPGVALGPLHENLVWKAAQSYQRRSGHRLGGRFILEKRIPHGGGLGGGSSDAAGTLRLLNEHHDRPLDRAALAELALELGSDVPFFLEGGRRIGRGRGEHLTETEPPQGPRKGFLLLPGIHVSTPAVFKAYAMGRRPEKRNAPPQTGENDLLDAALSVSAPFAQVWHHLQRHLGAEHIFMTGSGSTCVWLTEEPSFPRAAAAPFKVQALPFHFVN